VPVAARAEKVFFKSKAARLLMTCRCVLCTPWFGGGAGGGWVREAPLGEGGVDAGSADCCTV
jgi:hypothetical protein